MFYVLRALMPQVPHAAMCFERCLLLCITCSPDLHAFVPYVPCFLRAVTLLAPVPRAQCVLVPQVACALCTLMLYEPFFLTYP